MLPLIIKDPDKEVDLRPLKELASKLPQTSAARRFIMSQQDEMPKYDASLKIQDFYRLLKLEEQIE